MKPQNLHLNGIPVSIDGLIKAAENVGKIGEPVINLSGKALSLLMGGLTSFIIFILVAVILHLPLHL